MKFESRIEISPDVLFQEIDGETVLLDLKGEAYFGLDATGTRIWQLLQERQTVPELFRVMAAEYEVDPGELKKDLVRHLEELEEAGLINIIEHESA